MAIKSSKFRSKKGYTYKNYLLVLALSFSHMGLPTMVFSANHLQLIETNTIDLTEDTIALNILQKMFLDYVIDRGLDSISNNFLASTQKVKKSQKLANKDFNVALKRINELSGIKPSKLEKKYKQIKKNSENCQAKAQKFSKTIEEMEYLGNALFEAWGEEINQLSDPNLKNKSATMFKNSFSQYQNLMNSLRNSESRMYQTLHKYGEQVTFLSHLVVNNKVDEINQVWKPQIESEIAGLIAEMTKSIDTTQRFIDSSIPN